MIGMSFVSFLILWVISIVVSAILHYGFKYYVTPGIWSFCSKVIVGWIGAWLGSPVVGHWFDTVAWPAPPAADTVYIIPAILGSAALVIVAVDMTKMYLGKK